MLIQILEFQLQLCKSKFQQKTAKKLFIAKAKWGQSNYKIATNLTLATRHNKLQHRQSRWCTELHLLIVELLPSELGWSIILAMDLHFDNPSWHLAIHQITWMMPPLLFIFISLLFCFIMLCWSLFVLNLEK